MKRTQIGPFKLSLQEPHVPAELWSAIADPADYARRQEQERWRQVRQQKEREERRGTNPAAAAAAAVAAATTTMEEEEKEEGEGEDNEAPRALEIDLEDAELLLATLRSRLKLMEALGIALLFDGGPLIVALEALEDLLAIVHEVEDEGLLLAGVGTVQA